MSISNYMEMFSNEKPKNTKFEYRVQLGKNKSSYKTQNSFSTLERAMLYYQAYNVHSGNKKRLVEFNKSNGSQKIIKRYISQ